MVPTLELPGTDKVEIPDELEGIEREEEEDEVADDNDGDEVVLVLALLAALVILVLLESSCNTNCSDHREYRRSLILIDSPD